jgi:luciferase-like monooxygenase
MTKQLTASERIITEVTSWPGVEAGPGKRGEYAFKLGGREFGHLHGDRAAHFSFPKDVWSRLKDEGRITHHPVFPDSTGPAARSIKDDADIRDVVELLRLNYDRLLSRFGLTAIPTI